VTALTLERRHLERIVIEVALWATEGEVVEVLGAPFTLAHPAPDEILDAVDSGAWRLDLFTDPTCRTVARLILLEVEQGRPPTPMAMLVWLVIFGGMDPIDAGAAISSPGAFEASGCRPTGSLGYWLHTLADLHERETLAAAIARAQNALGVTGSADRVRDALRTVVSA
jgi:hypothetical protein